MRQYVYYLVLINIIYSKYKCIEYSTPKAENFSLDRKQNSTIYFIRNITTIKTQINRKYQKQRRTKGTPNHHNDCSVIHFLLTV